MRLGKAPVGLNAHAPGSVAVGSGRGDPAPEDARRVEEGPAAAGGHVQAGAEALPAVVVGVARDHEQPVALQREVERLEDLDARGARLEEGVHRIGEAEHEGAVLGVLARLGEVALLVEVDDAELAIDAPEIELGGEAEGPVARRLHRGVALEREGGALGDVPPDPERLDPLDEVADLTGAIDLIGGDGGGAVDLAAPLAEHAPEPVEAGVPVVVAGDAHQHPPAPVVPAAEDAVVGHDDAVVDLELGGDRVRRVAAEHEDVTARQRERAPGRVRVVDLVRREEQPGDLLAHRAVGAGVGDEVDPEIAGERLGQRLPVAARADLARHAPGELGGIVGPHPVAAVDVLGGRGGGGPVAGGGPPGPPAPALIPRSSPDCGRGGCRSNRAS